MKKFVSSGDRGMILVDIADATWKEIFTQFLDDSKIPFLSKKNAVKVKALRITDNPNYLGIKNSFVITISPTYLMSNLNTIDLLNNPLKQLEEYYDAYQKNKI